MDSGDARGLIALVTMLTFLGICWWAYRGANRRRFEEDAQLPFADEPGSTTSVTQRRGSDAS